MFISVISFGLQKSILNNIQSEFITCISHLMSLYLLVDKVHNLTNGKRWQIGKKMFCGTGTLNSLFLQMRGFLP